MKFQIIIFEQFANLIKNLKTYDYDRKIFDECYQEYKDKFYDNLGAITKYNITDSTDMIAFRTQNKQETLLNEDLTRLVAYNNKLIQFPLKENKAKTNYIKQLNLIIFLINIM